MTSSTLTIGKYGYIQCNQIIGRPFYLTFEITEDEDTTKAPYLRVVSAAELHADTILQQAGVDASDSYDDAADFDTGSSATGGAAPSNRLIVDTPSNQRLTMAEIESLKSGRSGDSKEIISRILESHSSLDQKTTFSLAKYTMRKHKKYLKQFSVLPLDVMSITDWLTTERDLGKVLEVRNETLALACSWTNLYRAISADINISPPGRHLVIDDTGGLIVAAMAEKMGIMSAASDDHERLRAEENANSEIGNSKDLVESHAESASENSITLLHSNSQPNLALLRYFGFDISASIPQHHALHTHLKTLSWRQLLRPESDQSCIAPDPVSTDILASWKSNKRGAYHRKQRRWMKTKSIVDETRRGGFQAVFIATHTSPVSILQHVVPLLAGGAQVVIFSPHIEPLVDVVDAYSTARRSAFINTSEGLRVVPSCDFPLDPSMLIAPSIQTVRIDKWQTLPGRTHPCMMAHGGAEGYLVTATRVHPSQEKMEARGVIGKKQKLT